jgi:hypothetical protein
MTPSSAKSACAHFARRTADRGVELAPAVRRNFVSTSAQPGRLLLQLLEVPLAGLSSPLMALRLPALAVLLAACFAAAPNVWLAAERYDHYHDVIPDWLWNGGLPFNHYGRHAASH